jgi:hypothetical protein
MMGGSVEFSVLKIETSYLADPLMADLDSVFEDK